MKKTVILIMMLVGFIACDDILEVENISSAAVVILAPANDVVIDTTAVTFTWEALEGAERYQLQIAKPTFEDAQQIVKDTTITNTNVLVILENGDFQWRVKGINSAYQSKFTINSFTINE
ncbi:hypothetical protein [Pontimicrobium sp. SW4]|uniref:SusE outer membrane protein domain-containing protein n=1 Tax=Pontimicrobium sp. SW4 TaxID=3153519 RepID=A0AAU7BQE4_9FLAO